MRTWKNSPYTLTINNDADPLYTLYYGKEVVVCTTARKDEIMASTCRRVIHDYLRYKCYNHWINITKLSGYGLDPHLEQTWLEFLQSRFAVKLKTLLATIEKDLQDEQTN